MYLLYLSLLYLRFSPTLISGVKSSWTSSLYLDPQGRGVQLELCRRARGGRDLELVDHLGDADLDLQQAEAFPDAVPAVVNGRIGNQIRIRNHILVVFGRDTG